MDFTTKHTFLSIFKFHFFLMCICVCLIVVYANDTVFTETRRGHQIPGAGGKGSSGCWTRALGQTDLVLKNSTTKPSISLAPGKHF